MFVTCNINSLSAFATLFSHRNHFLRVIHSISVMSDAQSKLDIAKAKKDIGDQKFKEGNTREGEHYASFLQSFVAY